MRQADARALLLGAFVATACGGRAPAAHDSTSHDTRTAVALPADGQQAVLREMRQMLAALGGAASAATREDTTALLAAIAPAGTAAAADPALEALLPTEWKELAERTHGGFDSLAMAVRRAPRGAALRDTVLVRMSQLVSQCNACHEAFRVTVKME